MASGSHAESDAEDDHLLGFGDVTTALYWDDDDDDGEGAGDPDYVDEPDEEDYEYEEEDEEDEYHGIGHFQILHSIEALLMRARC